MMKNEENSLVDMLKAITGKEILNDQVKYRADFINSNEGTFKLIHQNIDFANKDRVLVNLINHYVDKPYISMGVNTLIETDDDGNKFDVCLGLAKSYIISSQFRVSYPDDGTRYTLTKTGIEFINEYLKLSGLENLPKISWFI